MYGVMVVLVDEVGLVLFVFDYEYVFGDVVDFVCYQVLCLFFEESGLFELFVGFNFGCQFDWLQVCFFVEFVWVWYVLMYLQFWVWWLCGVLVSEIILLGCYIDLWQLWGCCWFGLVECQGWQGFFLLCCDVWVCLGWLYVVFVVCIGLLVDCEVVCGIYDSNVLLLCYLLVLQQGGFCMVLFIGIWLIVVVLGLVMLLLVEVQDMLVNCNVFGKLVFCMCFMGGCEFVVIVGLQLVFFGVVEIEKLLVQQILVLFCFVEIGGFFVGQVGCMEGLVFMMDVECVVLVMFYVVLMVDYCFLVLGVEGVFVIVEGVFMVNFSFGVLLVGLCDGCEVVVLDDVSGMICGGWLLVCWGEFLFKLVGEVVVVLNFVGWCVYCEVWWVCVFQENSWCELVLVGCFVGRVLVLVLLCVDQVQFCQ